MAEDNISQEKGIEIRYPLKIMMYFNSEDHLRDIPFIELLQIKDIHKLDDHEFKDIKSHRRKLRSRMYSKMSRERKIKELKDLEEIHKCLLQQQRELEHDILQLKDDISKAM
ncbi:hypothetical protein LOD99_1873 [Oopsacas minuta]|uniref:Basic leucine zipper domain-containing protein n=1 Tax=Oopsacas minuta TaxID=111878 RepID=A0AAV7K3K3_9METZ|nr:hypothetical protein LOD99_1873 [Oopsacas minuta]